MVTLIFKFDPRKGQLQVKLGQIKSNFKIQNFLTKTCLSCAVLSQDSNNVICFHIRQLEMPKNAFQICDIITFRYLFFWPLHSQKQSYCFELWYACCLYVFRSHAFRFLVNWKFSDFIGNYFWKDEIWNFEVKIEKYQISEMAIL